MHIKINPLTLVHIESQYAEVSDPTTEPPPQIHACVP